MGGCMVFGCSSRSNYVRLYSIPSGYDKRGRPCQLSIERRKQWIAAVKRKYITKTMLKLGRICSKHFVSGRPAALEAKNSVDWFPSVNMGFREKGPSQIAKQDAASLAKMTQETGASSNTVADEEASKSVSKEDLETALKEYRSELYELRTKIANIQFSEAYFENSEERTLYYTGFPSFVYLKTIYNAVEENIPHSHLTKCMQLVLTLIKLRLNLQFKDLSYRFQCNHASVVTIYLKVLDILFHGLKTSILWPDEETLMMNMPKEFTELFGLKTMIIVDCLELLIEKPTDPDVAAKTWSSYKHHHTLKFLLGIAPHGAISFISNPYGGGSSDEFIIEDSGFLDKLKPGDMLMADTGFFIKDSSSFCYGEVEPPAFLEGKNQLAVVVLEDAQELDNVTIYIRKVLGVLKEKYQILRDILPATTEKETSGLNVINKIVVVCCSLLNVRPAVVPLNS